MKHYHCTDYLNAQTILSSGYRVKLDEDYFYNGFYEDHVMLQRGLFSMLSEEAKRRVGAFGEDGPSKRQYDDLVVEWLRDYGHGTIIWVSEDGPDFTYGDNCLEVTLPGDAVLISKDPLSGGLGGAYWYDEPVIPSRHFKLHSTSEE